MQALPEDQRRLAGFRLNDRHEGGMDVPIDEELYTISVYAAQTGTQVGKPQTIDSDSTTCPDEISTVNGSTPAAFDATLTLSDIDSAVDSAVSNPAS
jgi:hypothetical protein